MGRVGEASSRLAGVVVKLHQAEYQVRGHQLKRIWWISYDIPRGEREQMEASSKYSLYRSDFLSLGLKTLQGSLPFGTLALRVYMCIS